MQKKENDVVMDDETESFTRPAINRVKVTSILNEEEYFRQKTRSFQTIPKLLLVFIGTLLGFFIIFLVKNQSTKSNLSSQSPSSIIVVNTQSPTIIQVASSSPTTQSPISS